MNDAKLAAHMAEQLKARHNLGESPPPSLLLTPAVRFAVAIRTLV
jgi:hypothetical protein